MRVGSMILDSCDGHRNEGEGARPLSNPVEALHFGLCRQEISPRRKAIATT
jgi:hypothetical protein